MNFRNLFKISSSSVLRLTHGIFRQISNVTILEMIRGDWLKAQWCQIAWLHQSGVTENSFWPKSIEKLRGIKNSAKPQIALHGLVIQLRRVCTKSWVFSQEGPRTPLWGKGSKIFQVENNGLHSTLIRITLTSFVYRGKMNRLCKQLFTF